jgi:ornithine cyclodeaminase/alanine dehydrogenase-like protein (mu-crystallin family)
MTTVRSIGRPIAVLGTGVQARSHARAVSRVRPVPGIRLAGRTPSRAEALAAELQTELDAEVCAVGSYREAMDGAHIVCATTHPGDPVVRREWLQPGTHVTSVGWAPAGREVDDATVADALVCVESRRVALAPVSAAGSPDLAEPPSQGILVEDDIVELGELVGGTRPGRTSPDQIRLYKSVSVAVEDATAAALVL